MDLFGESEVVFPGTYRKNAPLGRTLSIKTNAIVNPSGSVDAQELAGSFGFPEDSGLENRFILWRAAGPNIVFEEYAADRELSGATLCLHFDHSTVVKGTEMYISGGRLVVVVPTQSSVHRFFFRIYEDDATLSLHGKAVLSLFPAGDALDAAHQEHVYSTSGMVVSTDVTVLPSDQTLVASHLHDGQVVVVLMPALLNQNENFVEKVLKTSGFFARFMRTEDNFNVISVAATYQGLVYALYSDFRIRVWSTETFQVLQSVELMSVLSEEPVDLRLVSIKASTFGVGEFGTIVTVCVKQAAITKFLFFGAKANSSNELQYLATIRGSSAGDIIDFEVMDEGEGSVQVWGIRRNSAKRVGVPYNLVRCTVNFDDCIEHWVEVRNVSSVEPKPEDGAPLRQKVDYVKRRVFGGEDFAFDVVLRSINMVCKGAETKSYFPDFMAVQKHVEEYLECVHFKDRYTTRNERVALSYIEKNALEAATEKFWNLLLDTCEQFQAASGFLPLAIWSAPQLDLTGVIQQSRFTVSTASDEEIETLMAPFWKKDDSVVVERILRDTENIRNSTNLTDSNVIALKGTIIGNIKRLRSIAMRFADHSPFCVNNGVRPPSFEYGNSSFSAGLLAAALRRYVVNRLEFASILRDIINITVESTSRAGGCSAGQKDREFTTRMNATFTNYNVLAHALSSRVIIRSPAASFTQAGEASTKKQQVSVAEAFFTLGGPSLLVASGASVASSASGEEGENQNEMAIDADILGNEGANRFDRRRQSSVAVHPFSRFIIDTSFASIFFLWPESPDLMLPRFLREQKFFSALQQYCIFNDSTLDCDLKYALRFYQAIAYSGSGYGDKAVAAFKDSIAGIDRPDDDDPLNKAFSASNQRHGVSHVNRTTYFIDVLHSLQEHGHTDQLLDMGKLAISGAADLKDPSLQEIFTIVFRHQMLSGQYEGALSTVQSNPIAETRTVCLRDLLSKMLLSKRYDILLAMDFGYLYTTVIDFVDMRVRSYDIVKDSELFDLLASLYFKGRLYRRAAKTSYELATRLNQVPFSFDNLERRCEALLKSSTLLSLVNRDEFRWIDIAEALQPDDDSMDTSSADLDSSMASQQSQIPKKTRVRIVTHEEIKREWFLETMRQQVIDKHGITATAPSADPEEVAHKLIINKDFDNAWTLIGMFKLEPFTFLEAVAVECMKIDKAAKSHFPSWVYNNLRYSFDPNVEERHWHTLRCYLRDGEQDSPNDSRLHKTIAYALLTHSWKIPEWLERKYMEQDFGDFLRCVLDFGDIEDAFRLTEKYIDNFNEKLQGPEAAEAISVLLPINELDDLLEMSSEEQRFEEQKKQLVNRINALINKIVTVEKSANFVRS